MLFGKKKRSKEIDRMTGVFVMTDEPIRLDLPRLITLLGKVPAPQSLPGPCEVVEAGGSTPSFTMANHTIGVQFQLFNARLPGHLESRFNSEQVQHLESHIDHMWIGSVCLSDSGPPGRVAQAFATTVVANTLCRLLPVVCIVWPGSGEIMPHDEWLRNEKKIEEHLVPINWWVRFDGYENDDGANEVYVGGLGALTNGPDLELLGFPSADQRFVDIAEHMCLDTLANGPIASRGSTWTHASGARFRAKLAKSAIYPEAPQKVVQLRYRDG